MGKGKKRDKKNDKVKERSGKPRHNPTEPRLELTVDNVSIGIWPPTESYVDEGQIFKQTLERFSLYEDLIYKVPNILSPEECAKWIQYGEETGFLEAKQASSAGYAFRDNGRLSLHCLDVAQRIFDRVRKVVPPELDSRKAIGCSPNIRIYRYTKGQRFGKHIDESCFDEESQAWSEFTLLFYLNDEGLEGGETAFFKGNTGGKLVLQVPPETGTGLLHWHGDRCLLHSGEPVRNGVKYLLRTDVLYR
mmetsp:Transcript_19847/g.32620  ORF Transcript_19847/g.32620 Transcript_19847/m.32620 type:complete len:248 (+) Transcript_19847:631-1374(+)|eukprot:CAMPEP_0203751024 /NCGR_PEP_ID=MMETSP0098-20131031/5159_1 /ASSEMBLY_ACC=CAM_ASM_000208 /TAXON_ID=96639 /ORGANISM=" , Strain NY0313808BC1" /LENGTH=247 /DNA_ID=CAMNT_0050640553 /DNA_START=263 /DNA_END=1006 /DNA_ORIENTATION=-